MEAVYIVVCLRATDPGSPGKGQARKANKRTDRIPLLLHQNLTVLKQFMFSELAKCNIKLFLECNS